MTLKQAERDAMLHIGVHQHELQSLYNDRDDLLYARDMLKECVQLRDFRKQYKILKKVARIVKLDTSESPTKQLARVEQMLKELAPEIAEIEAIVDSMILQANLLQYCYE